MRRIVVIYFFLLLLISCKSVNDNELIQGEWSYFDILNLSLKNEHNFIWQGQNDFVFTGKYKLNSKNDSLTFQFTEDFNVKYRYKILDNKLILWNNKAESGKLSGHIDEILTFYKRTNETDGIKNTGITECKDKFILPLNYRGAVYISYNQYGVENNQTDRFKNRIIYVSDNGLVKTQFRESEITYALRNFEFILNGNIIPFFVDDMIYLNAKDVIEKEGMHMDSVYICVYGFNQEGRKKINELYHENIEGNILMFNVDTLKHILRTINKY